MTRAKEHAAKWGPLYAALALLGSGAGATQMESARRLVCGPDASELMQMQGEAFALAMSAATDRLEQCAQKLSRRCR